MGKENVANLAHRIWLHYPLPAHTSGDADRWGPAFGQEKTFPMARLEIAQWVWTSLGFCFARGGGLVHALRGLAWAPLNSATRTEDPIFLWNFFSVTRCQRTF